MTTGNIVGKGIRGTIKPYLTDKSRIIGASGKITNIGKNKIIGVFRV
jgi:hypothetical protein